MSIIVAPGACRQGSMRIFCFIVIPLTLILMALSARVFAHEVRPAITDLSVQDQSRTSIVIRLNLEALIARIGPQHSDTDDSQNSAKYDALRRLPPVELQEAFEKFEPEFLAGIRLENQLQQPLAVNVDTIEIHPTGNLELARDSTLRLTAELPANTESISWSWRSEFGPNIVRVLNVTEHNEYSAYLIDGRATDMIPVSLAPEQSAWQVIVNYAQIGFEHILPKGLDHILFVVGLFLLSTSMRPLLIQVTSFTIAHTVTLALGVSGLVSLSASVVEPLIAASIVYVCVENILSDKLQRWRPMVVFGFGLLHGLGFAGVLSEIGLSSSYFITALLSFNLGVELGQIAVIIACFLLIGFWFGKKTWYRRVVSIPLSGIIALIGVFWFLQRTGFIE